MSLAVLLACQRKSFKRGVSQIEDMLGDREIYIHIYRERETVCLYTYNKEEATETAMALAAVGSI